MSDTRQSDPPSFQPSELIPSFAPEQESKLKSTIGPSTYSLVDYGKGPVAILDDGVSGERIPLNEDNLRLRISNLKAQGRSTEVEESALHDMLQIKSSVHEEDGEASAPQRPRGG